MQIYLQSTVYLCGDTKHLANHIIFFLGGDGREQFYVSLCLLLYYVLHFFGLRKSYVWVS